MTIPNTETYSKYIKDIGKVKVLSTDDERQLIIDAQNGDKEARDLLVRANLKFVIREARTYDRYGINIEDLIQEGNIGLLKAIDKFDVSRGVKLLSYASYWINHYIKRYVMENYRVVKIAYSTNDHQRLFFHKGRLVSVDGERQEENESISEDLGIPVNRIEDMRNRLYSTNLLSPVKSEFEDSNVLEEPREIADESAISAEDEYIRNERLRCIEKALSVMPEAERDVFIRRHRHEETFKSIASSYGKSHQWASDVYRKVLKAIKKHVERKPRKVNRSKFVTLPKPPVPVEENVEEMYFAAHGILNQTEKAVVYDRYLSDTPFKIRQMREKYGKRVDGIIYEALAKMRAFTGNVDTSSDRGYRAARRIEKKEQMKKIFDAAESYLTEKQKEMFEDMYLSDRQPTQEEFRERYDGMHKSTAHRLLQKCKNIMARQGVDVEGICANLSEILPPEECSVYTEYHFALSAPTCREIATSHAQTVGWVIEKLKRAEKILKESKLGSVPA